MFPNGTNSHSGSSPKLRVPEHRLTLKEVLDDLVADGLVAKADADLTLAGPRI